MEATSILSNATRLVLTATLAVMLAACSGGDSEAIGVGPDAGPSPDAGASDALGDAAFVACPFEIPLEFGASGIVTEPGVLYRHTGCLIGTRFNYGSWQEDNPNAGLLYLSCWTEPTFCGPDSALADVHESLTDPEVAAALAQTPPAIYGLDQRNVDDGMYVVRWGTDCSMRLTTIDGFDKGSGFDLGAPCEAGTLDCHPVAPAITLFVDRLKELERQKRTEKNCRGI